MPHQVLWASQMAGTADAKETIAQRQRKAFEELQAVLQNKQLPDISQSFKVSCRPRREQVCMVGTDVSENPLGQCRSAAA